MKTAYLVVSCFCFGWESCSNLFQVFSNDFHGVFVFGSWVLGLWSSFCIHPVHSFWISRVYQVIGHCGINKCFLQTFFGSRARFQIMSVDTEHSKAFDEGEERIETLKQEKARDKIGIYQSKDQDVVPSGWRRFYQVIAAEIPWDSACA